MEFDYKMRLEKFQQGQQNNRYYSGLNEQKRQADLEAAQKGYVWNANTKSWEFSEEALRNAEKSYKATHKSSTSTTPKSTGQETTNYNPLKGTHYINSKGEAVNNAKGNGVIVSTEKLKSLEPSQLESLFDYLNIRFDKGEYADAATGDIDWDRVIRDYSGYLDKYEFKYHDRGKVISIDSRGANTKVATNAQTISNKYGIEPPQQAKDEEDDGSGALE